MLERVTVVALVVVLFVLGALLAIVGAFVVPTRIGGVPGIAIVVAVVGNVAVGALRARGLGSGLGALVPAAGWLIVCLLANSSHHGSVIIPGTGIPGDAASGYVGMAFLVVGLLAWGAGYGLATRLHRRTAVRSHPPS